MTGRLVIIGTGPGGLEHLSPAASRALEGATDLVAYPLYVDLLGEIVAGKARHDSPLGDEIGRARRSLELAAEGRSVALISSGDAGIYAMATLVFELLEHEALPAWHELEIAVVPGISALQACASRVGAPLAHDFCTISLSDLLTPWESIETRIRAAGLGDFVVAFYNPVSQKRTWQLARARELLMEKRPADTPVIIGRNVTRATEQITVTTLGELDPAQVDMLTIVLVGNSETRRVGQWVYTPRGYAKKLGADA
nr:precorrin-3B C(17)-methyltransferase [Pseudomonas luteola]